MIFVTGDTHGDFSRLNSKNFPFQNMMTKEDYVIIAGDFGIWRDNPQSRNWLKWLNEKPFTTLFVDGNHENYDLLAEYPVGFWNGGVVQFINESVIHLMRGEVYILQGKTFFTMGGASCHDIQDGILEKDDPDLREKKRKMEAHRKMYRVNHESWWAQELPNNLEYENAIKSLQRYNWEVDYVITHCAPEKIARLIADDSYPKDNLTIFLEAVAQKLNYKVWVFGHYHKNLSINNRFILLYQEIVEIASDEMLDGSIEYIDVRKLPKLDLSEIKERHKKLKGSDDDVENDEQREYVEYNNQDEYDEYNADNDYDEYEEYNYD